MTVLHREQSLLEVVPDVLGVLLEPVLDDDVENRGSDRARDRVAAEGVEVLHPGVERVGDLTGGHHRRQRMAVSKGLAHGDDVGHDTAQFEPPERVAHSADPDLHLIGDHQSAGSSGRSERGREVPLGKTMLPGATKMRKTGPPFR
jgi:hypothetical protein